MAAPARVVSIPWELLSDPEADLSRELWEGFGPDGLGIITVSGVPDYVALREQLLPLAETFARLPEDVRRAHEHAASSYNVGWSHGKEALRGGVRDTHKGSFYANPMQDSYDHVDPRVAERYRTYYSPNVWPRQDLPELEAAFKQLGRLVVSVGLRLAGKCSRYVQQQLANAAGAPLTADQAGALDFERQLGGSQCHKARLLHYFPRGGGDGAAAEEDGGRRDQQQPAGGGDAADWCGWHLDHGALTGLTCAMYLDSGRPVPSPDPSAGLYACDRSGRVVQVSIPPDHLAFQLGQVMAIQSGGLLRATPHCVRAASAGPPGVSRNTFAVFMQPEAFCTRLDAPPGAEALDALGLSLDRGHWEPGMTFGEFADLTLSGYYDQHRQPQQQQQQGAAAGAAAAAPAKDVAPAAAHAAAEAASRRFSGGRLQLLVSHE